MSRAHYFYFRESLLELERIVKDHQDDFEILVNDTFSESELASFETLLDSIAAIFVQPIFTELTFNDFVADEKNEAAQKQFFESCQSSICLDHLPDFHLNPFQVTYLIELLRNFNEVLIDRGGMHELMFKKDYIEELKGFKNIFSLIPSEEKPKETKTTKPVDPIDFLIADVWKELERLDSQIVETALESQGEKLRKAYSAVKDERLDSSTLLRKSGLNAKDFDDNLERLKFLLKKL